MANESLSPVIKMVHFTSKCNENICCKHCTKYDNDLPLQSRWKIYTGMSEGCIQLE